MILPKKEKEILKKYEEKEKKKILKKGYKLHVIYDVETKILLYWIVFPANVHYKDAFKPFFIMLRRTLRLRTTRNSLWIRHTIPLMSDLYCWKVR